MHKLHMGYQARRVCAEGLWINLNCLDFLHVYHHLSTAGFSSPFSNWNIPCAAFSGARDIVTIKTKNWRKQRESSQCLISASARAWDGGLTDVFLVAKADAWNIYRVRGASGCVCIFCQGEDYLALSNRLPLHLFISTQKCLHNEDWTRDALLAPVGTCLQANIGWRFFKVILDTFAENVNLHVKSRNHCYNAKWTHRPATDARTRGPV